MDESFYQLFRDCIVRLSTKSDRGTGFFVAPGLILTCAHVVKGANANSIEVHWQNQPPINPTTVNALDIEWPDLALLEVPIRNHRCVYLDREVQPGHELYSYGYPDANRDGASITLECEGPSDNGRFLTIKDENVRPGFSGAPLLNQRTLKVCGIIKSERNLTVNTTPKILKGLGGQAIPTGVIFAQFPELERKNSEFHQQQNHWKKLISPQNSTQLPPRELQNRRNLLAQVNYEVEARLQQSLSDMVLINLGKAEQPNQVKHSWDGEIKLNKQLASELLSNIDIISVFDQAGGKLLILGEPGSGKTTSQLELARELIARAENNVDEPIPVIFNLSAWKNIKQPIVEWLVNKLHAQYGIRKDIGKQWLENKQLLPLLDGLNELESDNQEYCIRAINQFLQGEYRPNQLVVCSRRLEYELCGTKLLLNNAIRLQPLDNEQIYQYLVDVKRRDIWQYIEGDAKLLELAKSPWLLWVMTLVFVDDKNSDLHWQNLSSTEKRSEYLMNAYVQRMLTKEMDSKWYSKGREPTHQQTQRWLSWLAHRQIQQSQTEFLIEKIQPTWLQPGIQRWIYFVVVSLLSGIFVELTFGAIIGLIAGALRSDMIIGLLSGIAIGLVSSFSQEIKLFETVKWSWSWKKARNQVLLVLGSCLIVVLIIELTRQQINLSIIPLSKSWPYVSITVVIAAAIRGLFVGLIEPDIVRKTRPNQGIFQTAKNAVIFPCIIFILLIIPILIIQKTDVRLPFATWLGLVSLYAGGIGCIQHFTLRLILWCTGYAPWNYGHFLNYANERMFLHKVGGRYQFIHDSFRQHFGAKEQIYSQRGGQFGRLWVKLTGIGISLILLCIFSLFLPLATDSWKVNSELAGSLASRLKENDCLIVDKFFYDFKDIQRGDIIEYKVVEKMKQQGLRKIKPGFYSGQVIGFPQEIVTIRDGKIYIKKRYINSPLEIKPKFTIPLDYRYGPKTVPDYSYLVIVDEQTQHYDNPIEERLVDKSDVTGFVTFRYWPLNRLGKP